MQGPSFGTSAFRHVNIWHLHIPIYIKLDRQKVGVIGQFSLMAICYKPNIWIQVALVICGLFICEFAYMRMKNGLFFWNLSSNLQWLLVFLYANSLHASIFLESLSLAYNEVYLYMNITKLWRHFNLTSGRYMRA